MKKLHEVVLIGFLLGVVGVACGQVALRDQAREAAAAGQSDAAIRLYRSALQQDPKDTDTLAALSNLLEAAGKWRDAVPLLETLVTLQPENHAALTQLGRFKSWQGSGQRAEALDLLRRGCAGSHDTPEYCDAYAEVLSWGDSTRPQAIQRLETTLTAHPESAPTRVKLAQILSWRESTRPQAGALLEAGLRTDPGNKDLLLASASVLSWNPSTRAEALVRYNRVLESDPENAQALVGKARLLAWQDRADESLVLYQRVLDKDPNNVAAMQGRATILNWKGRHKEARALALRAHAAEPTDRQAALELALADIGLNRFSEARDVLSGVEGGPGPDFDAARQEVRRGLGSYIETGYGLRTEQGNLEFNRFDVAISTRLNAANRVTFVYQPTLYTTNGPSFNTNYFGTSLDSEISDRLSSHIRA
ncbi:MAG TPA: tetratricopeptide repeat protein, partial [Alphaproteobacteria bacterium]|nr:tetratricopeptide repeat protein [Alphaproteobacteria bacterium]